MNLLLSEHLKESFHTTAYAINVYVLPGANAVRLARYTREDIEAGKGTRIFASFVKKAPKKQSRRSTGKQPADTGPAAPREDFFATAANGKKRKRKGEVEQDPGVEDVFALDDDDNAISLYADDDDPTEFKTIGTSKPTSRRRIDSGSEEEDDDDADWTFNLRSKPATGQKLAKSSASTLNRRLSDGPGAGEIDDDDEGVGFEMGGGELAYVDGNEKLSMPEVICAN